jgi:DNA polymerase-3 subunit gamma/tau
MSYTVLARRYRSWTFDEIVGQEPIVTTLKNAIASGRVHHGYLFTGTRGVGKTSMARILARSLNCLNREGPSVDPCRECESCTAIAEGQDVDVIEIDAASHTGVDNIRELRANAIYRPARSRFKIYIIDEVHMLSTGAFNALLKTLEEPPEHIKFVLATTDPQKVPATIQSRCQRFDFHSISPEQIGEQIKTILAAEGCTADEAVVRRVARLANGSMRDALSLLDQLMSMSAERLTLDLLEEVLPTPHDQLLAALIDRCAEHDAAGALVALDQCIGQGYSLERFCDAMIEQWRTLMLMRVCGADTVLADVPPGLQAQIAARSAKFDAAFYVHAIAMLEELRRNVRFSQAGRALTEAVVVRLSEAVPQASVAALIARIESAGGSTTGAAAPSAPAGRGAEKKVPGAAGQGPPQGTPGQAAADRASGPSVARPASPPPTAPSRAASARGRARTRGETRPGPPPIQPGRVTREDLRAAKAEPVVQKALELFEGTLLNVERIGPPAETPDSAPEDESNAGSSSGP